ncbi:polysaccharide deacetylase family protein [Paenibacillus glufosinatiresistens]|uniref:polysaccharide deacetylase family protein n=1 Tax=Paenibacillus glufosinatiresistens TaxID=3070657 RepID=UPI00286D8868|nr:polysaccharide deacetylase family protein [Paenibacillus sp. YX.27]
MLHRLFLILAAALLLLSPFPGNADFRRAGAEAARWSARSPAASDSETAPAPASQPAGRQRPAASLEKAEPPLTLSQLIRRYPEIIRARGPRTREIALTFDDVPDPRFTPAILDVLKRSGVKATFFIVGSRAEKHPDLVARIVRDGHSIGNHSYNHPLFTKMGVAGFRSQILRTDAVLKRTAGYRSRLIRPPYGEITEKQLHWARSNGYRIINWNVDSQDWRGLSKAQVKRNVLSRAARGSIVLQHGGGGVGSDLSGTIKALPEIIGTLRARGYRLVTVPELLDLPER